MQESSSQEQEAIRAELGEARGRLAGLVGDLRAIDGELEDLSAERHHFRLLDDLCGSLEELGRIGAADLFWKGAGTDLRAEEHLRTVRARVDTFQKRIDEIEGRRQEVLEAIDRTEESTSYLEDDLYEFERQEELRKLEWIPDREIEAFPIPYSRMPWARGGEEDQRFRKNLAALLLLSLLLGLILPMIQLPMPDPFEEIEIPDRLTRLIAEQRPPPVPVQKQTRPEELQPTEELVPEETQTKATAETEAAPEPDASSKGILAFREKFSSLAENDPAARLGSQARIDDSGEAAVGRTTRSMVTTQAPGSSGGINLASLSRNAGTGGNGNIAGVQVARATSSIGGSGTGGDRPLAGGPGAGRTDEEIQIVFDRHKAALYRLYNRELRKDPTLEGQMVLRLRIEPDGSVSLCELHSSDMHTPSLESQVVARVETFDFGAKEVPPVTILYPIDFLPAT